MKSVSDQLFMFEKRQRPRLGHERCSAKDLGLDESWLRDGIFENPDLVIGPCRAAGLTDDEWYPWQREFRVEVGRIDVLLLSSQGRVAIVETKSHPIPNSEDGCLHRRWTTSPIYLTASTMSCPRFRETRVGNLWQLKKIS